METINMEINRSKDEAISLIAHVMYGPPKVAELAITVFNKKTRIKKKIEINIDGKMVNYLKINGPETKEYPKKYWGNKKEFMKFMNKII